MGTTTNFVFGRLRGTTLLGLALLGGLFSCAPDPVDRIDVDRLGDAGPRDTLSPNDRTVPPDTSARGGAIGTGGGGGTVEPGGNGGAGGAGGSGGAVPVDVRDAATDDRVSTPDVVTPMDLPVDLAVDNAPRPDLVPDVPRNRTVLMVVADPTAMASADVRLRTVLETKGFTVRLGDDDATAMASTAGVALVVLTGTADSAKLAAKYRDVALPVLVLELAIFDDMRLTGAVENTDWGADTVSQVTLLSNHPMAGGLAGTVAIMSMSTKVGWCKPAASAIKVASTAGMADHTAMFGYEAGATMVGGMAMGRRVGMFPGDTNAMLLTADGIKLVSAALDWLFQ